MTEFARPRDSFRFLFGGLKTNVLPDALPPGKYPLAQNVRATQDDALQTRPGQLLKFATPSAVAITDLRTYAALATDDRPRLLARDTADAIWLDTGTTPTQVGTLAPGGLGATMIPFRPNASPTPWMYIANGADYQKLSAPGAGDAVTQAAVGIAEPQSSPDAYLSSMLSVYVDGIDSTPAFTPDGTAGSVTTGSRVSDTVVAVFPDPAAAGGSCPTTLQVTAGIPYQRFMKLLIGAGASQRFVQDVFTPIPASFIASIYYYSGTTGRCVIVPSSTAGYSQGPGSTTDSLYGALLLSSLRRGALVQVGAEVCFVLSATEGPNGTVCFETITTVFHTATEMLTGVPAIQVFDAQATAPGDALTSPDYFCAVTVGIGTVTAALAASFSESLRPTAYTNPSPFFVEAPNLPWANPASAFDGDPTTFASTALVGVSHSSCQWQTWPSPSSAYNTINLYVDSEVPAPSGAGAWSALLQYSADGGATWNDIYRVGGTGGAGSRLRQTDVVALPPGTDITAGLIVRVSTDALHDVDPSQLVYEISTIGVTAGPFTSPFILQPEDYVHVSLNVDDLSALNEMKLIFKIDDDNFYYYTIRPSDLAAAVANATTQIAAAQTIEQRAIIDQLDAAAANNQGQTASSAQTPPGSAQWAEITFPISALTRVGNDQTVSLASAADVVILFNAADTINVIWNSIYVFGGFQADVGDIGAPYLYRVRPRSKMTGVFGNPSPQTRYGVSSRRQQVTIVLPDATYDPQIDTWDIFRYGGSVTSWRYIGSTPSSSASFPDNYDDTAADAGAALDFDNFQPWPTIDLPNNGSASNVTGTTAVVNSATADILRYLPGTLVQLGGLNVYTLRQRPLPLDRAINPGPSPGGVFTTGTHEAVADVTLAPGVTTAGISPGDSLYISGNGFAAFNIPVTVMRVWNLTSLQVASTVFASYFADTGGTGGFLSTYPGATGTRYLLQFVENAGAAMGIPFAIQEPALANQPLPYAWGPNASGTVFAVGDPLRPGTLYFAKPNNPDSAPDTSNIEITPPSEPLIGGEVLDGLSIVGSTERWWALYPSSVFAGVGITGTQAQNYNIVQQPIPRGLAAPFGHCTDGISIFFWAKDGIWSSTKGSLTDADLYNLFPHDGVPGVNSVYLGIAVTAPDYSRAGTFRLEYSAYYLYATYQDSTGTYRTLVYDVRRGAWSVDVYTPAVTAFCHPEQQAGTLLTTSSRYPELLMATVDGRAATQTPASNDLDVTIACIVAVNEFDGGDLRAPKQWGDLFLDLVPAATGVTDGSPGVEVALMSLGNVAAGSTPQFIPPSSTRTRIPLSPGGILVADFLGVAIAWHDNFTGQSAPTQLYAWQPSFVVQPARTIEWFTFGTAFGLDGYVHIREIAVAYVAAAAVTLTITSFDGQSPAPITLPATGVSGAALYQKLMIPLTANKGQLYRFAATSALPFQFFFDEWETHVGQWRRQGPYASVRGFGGRPQDAAPI